jgi:hypothetical protein
MDLEPIRNKIYEIRGYKVLLDVDLAYMYGVETAQLKRAVRRNIERFEGEDFMFELTQDEVDSLRCQIGTLNTGGRGQHSKYLPFAFTEMGISMLSGVLNSEIAIATNRKIMRTFVAIRQYAMNYAELNQKIEKLSARLDDNDAKTDEVFNMLTKLFKQKEAFENRRPIGFNADRIIEQNKKLSEE